MGLFDFISNRRKRGSLQNFETVEAVESTIAPLTAQQAMAIADKKIRAIDTTFHLAYIGSSEDINHEGRASSWEIQVFFPNRSANGEFIVEPLPDDPDLHHLQLRSRITVDEPKGIASELLRRLEKNRKGLEYVRAQWKKSERSRPILPTDFIDSPEAVRFLAGSGVNWTSGSSSTLTSRVLPSGEAVWSTVVHNREFCTPFSLK